ncbi:murein hydrolase activator EnvC family protein [Microbacterium sp.]|uniref:murein hydrolase activator EnvC family protein n=1 Tax=Microbacterium sp. TaxID=51671 RepID=UPI0039E29822
MHPFLKFSLLLFAVLLWSGSAPPAASAPAAPGAADAGDWLWPVDGRREIVAAYRAPAHEYGAGHRGVDIAAPIGTTVRAPASGIVAFRGTVVDRPLITIAHEGGFVTTFEPVLSELAVGDGVEAGDIVGTVDRGGHTPPGALHIGVRLHGAYINPMLLFGEVQRAVLLPCCDPP